MPGGEYFRITWKNGAAFLAACETGSVGRYHLLGARARVLRDSRVGQEVAVELEFLDSARTFRHRARVAAIDAGPPERVALEFAPDEADVRELVICHARGESVPYLSRRAERFAVDLPVEYQTGLRWRSASASELSELGMFVTTATPPAAERVLVRIATEGGEPFEVGGRVIYIQGGDRAGFAMEFAFANRTDEVRVRRAVRAALQATKRS
jgi:hypothetical protein